MPQPNNWPNGPRNVICCVIGMDQENQPHFGRNPNCLHKVSSKSGRQILSDLPLSANDKVVISDVEETACDCVEWQRLEALLPPDRDKDSYSEVSKILPQLVCLLNVVILSNAAM